MELSIISNLFLGNDNLNILKEMLKGLLQSQFNKQMGQDDIKYLIGNMRQVYKQFTIALKNKEIKPMSLKEYVLHLNNKSIKVTMNGIKKYFNDMSQQSQLQSHRSGLELPVDSYEKESTTLKYDDLLKRRESEMPAISSEAENLIIPNPLMKPSPIINEPLLIRDHTNANQDIMSSLVESLGINEPKAAEHKTTEKTAETSLLNIDSRERDIHRYPNTNKYTIESLPINLKGVTKVKIKSLDFCKNNMNVTSTNNLLHFEETSNDMKVLTVPEGYYSKQELIDKVSELLNEVGSSSYEIKSLGNKLEIISNPNKEKKSKYIESKVHYFTMHGNMENSICPVLGFLPKVYGSNLKYISNHEMNLSLEKYVLLFIPEISDKCLCRLSLNDVIDTGNGVFEYKTSERSYLNISEVSVNNIDIDQLTIEYRIYNNELYNTGNLNNSLCIEFTT